MASYLKLRIKTGSANIIAQSRVTPLRMTFPFSFLPPSLLHSTELTLKEGGDSANEMSSVNGTQKKATLAELECRSARCGIF